MIHYRLLRNNQEAGPYTKDQLLQMGLKAYDLIWIEGKSAAWQYPSEMAEFIDFAPPIEEQPFDRFFKKDFKPFSTNQIQQKSLNYTEETKARKEKPRIVVDLKRDGVANIIINQLYKIFAKNGKP